MQPGGGAEVALTQVAARDLDVGVRGQLPAAELALGDQFEPGPLQMVCFETALRRGCLRKQGLENAPGNSHDTLIFADADAELDGTAFGIPSRVRRKPEKHS